MQEFLQASEIIDWNHPAMLKQAQFLASKNGIIGTAKNCFEFVRDQIKHSRDFQFGPATLRASDVLIHGTGYCYAKSHLLAALLRANGIPIGMCYQRLCIDDSGPPFSLHGYNAILLPGHQWYRVDARGSKFGVNAQFDPPNETLAFSLKTTGEYDFENIFANPLDCVVDALINSASWEGVLANLPDITPNNFGLLGLTVRAKV